MDREEEARLEADLERELAAIRKRWRDHYTGPHVGVAIRPEVKRETGWAHLGWFLGLSILILTLWYVGCLGNDARTPPALGVEVAK